MLVGRSSPNRWVVLHCKIAGLGLSLLFFSLLGCSSSPDWQPTEESADAGVGSDAAPGSLEGPITRGDLAPNPTKPELGTPPASGCGPAPLPLTRFPTSLRTTTGGRTFTGWGGAASAGVAKRRPIILVHGNGGTAEEWKPFRDDFCKAGYGDLEIWAITFQDNSCSGVCSSGSNTEHASELDRMIELVRAQTAAPKVSLVAISMGVTTARYYVKYLGGLKHDEVALAYLVSGPNHGLNDCDIPGAAYVNVACAELDATALKSGWLYKLNAPDETPNGPGDGQVPGKTILYRTVSYLKDPFFPGSYVSSPKLEGADNQVLPGSTHAAIDLADLLAYLKKAE